MPAHLQKEPQSHRHARMLLSGGRHKCQRVIAVDHDSILWLSDRGRPYTTWLHREGGKLRTREVEGFAATPPANWLDGRR
jgi:hypothetical protein